MGKTRVYELTKKKVELSSRQFLETVFSSGLALLPTSKQDNPIYSYLVVFYWLSVSAKRGGID